MRVAVIGRTRGLLDTGHRLLERGHQIGLVWTCPHDDYYSASNTMDFENLAREAGARFANDAHINRPENIESIRASRCDVGVSVNWITVMSRGVLDAFAQGVLNAHAGDLPRYRGNAPVNWAIIAGEHHVGMCIHRMAPELDAGPVYLRRKYSLGPDTYVGDVWAWIEAEIPQMFVEVVDGLATGHLQPEPQSAGSGEVLRGYPRRPEDGRIFWVSSVESIYRMVRASSRPFAGAFTTLEGRQKVIIWRAIPIPHPGAFLAVPGQICYRIDNDPVVACGDGMLRLTDVEIESVGDAETAKTLIHRSMRTRLV